MVRRRPRQLGGGRGTVDEDAALELLAAAVASGVTFLDTAGVYGDGRSERLIGWFLRGRAPGTADGLAVATKTGRRAQPHEPAAFTLDNFRAWTPFACEPRRRQAQVHGRW